MLLVIIGLFKITSHDYRLCWTGTSLPPEFNFFTMHTNYCWTNPVWICSSMETWWLGNDLNLKPAILICGLRGKQGVSLKDFTQLFLGPYGLLKTYISISLRDKENNERQVSIRLLGNAREFLPICHQVDKRLSSDKSLLSLCARNYASPSLRRRHQTHPLIVENVRLDTIQFGAQLS